jgi:hypothetical protein
LIFQQQLPQLQQLLHQKRKEEAIDCQAESTGSVVIKASDTEGGSAASFAAGTRGKRLPQGLFTG